MFYPNIDAAIVASNPFDEIIIFPGTYTQGTQIQITQPIAIQGYSADNTIIQFDSSLIVSLIIASDNVIIQNLHLIGPTMTTGDNWLFQISLKGFPSDFTKTLQ